MTSSLLHSPARVLRPAGALLLVLASLACLAAPRVSLAQGTPEDERDLIAVLDLKVVGGTEVEGVAISNTLREELLKTGHYKLINRNQMEAVLEEQSLQQVACTGAACVADVGKVLGVAYIVTGSVTKLSPELFQVSASLIDVATAETQRAESVLHEGSLVNLLRVGVPKLAQKLAGENGNGASVVAAAAAPAPSPAPAPAPEPAPAAGPLRYAYVQKKSMPSKRKDVASAVLEGKVLVLGGRDGLGLLEGRADLYDPNTDEWKEAKRLPTARANLTALTLGASVYAVGGYSPLSGASFANVDRYDAASRSWTTLDPLPKAISRAAGAAVGGKLYVIGGETDEGVVNSVQVYDPAAKAWGRAIDLPIKLSRASAAVLNGLIYVTGGYNGTQALNTLFVFDPVLNTWQQKAPLKGARAYHASAAVAGRVLVFGGELDGDQLDSVEEYDPESNTWTSRTKLPRALSRFSAVALGGKIYLTGGDDGSFGLSATNLNYSFE